MTADSTARDVSWRPDAYIGDLTVAMKRENGVVRFRIQRDDSVLLDGREFLEYGKAVSALYVVLFQAAPDAESDSQAVPAQNEQMSLL